MIYYKSYLLFCCVIIFASFDDYDCFRILKNLHCFIQRNFYHIPCNYQGLFREIYENYGSKYISPWKFAMNRNFDQKAYSDRTVETENKDDWNFNSDGNIKTKNIDDLILNSDRNVKRNSNFGSIFDSDKIVDLANIFNSNERSERNNDDQNFNSYKTVETNGDNGLSDFVQTNIEPIYKFGQNFFSDKNIETNGVRGLDDFAQTNIEPIYKFGQNFFSDKNIGEPDYFDYSDKNTDDRISNGFLAPLEKTLDY